MGSRTCPGHVDIREAREARRGAWGVGSVHHLAWRVDDEEHQVFVRSQVEAAGADATPVIDRFWFKSVYFKEPGGVLFELATDGPGFATDEDPAHLGETLVLPPWLEPSRERIEAVLPSLTTPDPRVCDLTGGGAGGSRSLHPTEEAAGERRHSFIEPSYRCSVVIRAGLTQAWGDVNEREWPCSSKVSTSASDGAPAIAPRRVTLTAAAALEKRSTSAVGQPASVA